MARKPRIHVEGGHYHVIQRGVERRDIFLDRADKDQFLDYLAETSQQHDFRVLAYVLMENHVHLALQAGGDPLADGMRSLFFRYAGYFNRKYQRSGHLFQGRYKSVLVSTDAYVKELIRYIHLNPVRAGNCRKAIAFQYSSHRGYSEACHPEWIAEDVVLRFFDHRKSTARKKLDAYVNATQNTAETIDFKRGNNQEYDALGPDGYVAEVENRAEVKHFNRRGINDIVDAVLAVYEIDEDAINQAGRQRFPAEVRAIIADLVRKYSDATVADVARRFNRNQSVLSRTASNMRQRMAGDKTLKKRYQQVLNELEVK